MATLILYGDRKHTVDDEWLDQFRHRLRLGGGQPFWLEITDSDSTYWVHRIVPGMRIEMIFDRPLNEDTPRPSGDSFRYFPLPSD